MKKIKILFIPILCLSIVTVSGCNNPPSASSSVDTPASESVNSEPISADDVEEELPYGRGNRFDYTNTAIHRFDYNGVRLSNDSLFKKEFNYAMEYLLQIPTDDLLKVMRTREGKDVPGSEYMGGWYDGGLWVAATFGQYVSSLARGYALTGDERLKAKATELIDGWGDTIADDGFFYFSPDRLTNSTHYTYDKVVLMCLDVYTFIGGEVGERALDYLYTATNFAVDYLGQKRTNAGPNGPDSGQSRNDGNSDTEWYTISENLYRCYLATGDVLFSNFADIWNYDYFWDALRTGDGTKYYNVHAYSHTNSIGGSALRYMVYGQERNKEIIMNAYNMYQNYECYPNGLYGTAERLVGTVRNLNDAIDSHINNCEVACNTWAGMKLIKSLTEITGDSKYQTWLEKLLYNGVLGMLRIRSDSVRRGITFYYANYQKIASKEYYGASWPCCSGTYFLDLCDVADQLYYYDDESLYVANYVGSQVTSNFNKKNVTLTCEANMPLDDKVALTVGCTNKVDFNLKIRVPSWSSGYSIKVNGVSVNAAIDEDGWVIVGSSFKNGDKIEMDFERTLILNQIVDGDDYAAMAMYGSVYYVAKDSESTTITLGNGKTIEDYIVGTNDTAFYVVDENGISFKFVPYYELQEEDEYAGNLTISYRGGSQND